MYKLYGDIGGLKNLDKSKNEKEIIETLTDYVKSSQATEYIVTKDYEDEPKDNQDIPYKKISTLEDYLDYMADYEDRQVKELKLTKE